MTTCCAVKECFPASCAERMPGGTQVITRQGENTDQFRTELTHFRQEAERLALLKGKNGVVELFELFEENSTAYIVKYMEGKTLKAALAEMPDGRFRDPAAAAGIILQTVASLEYIHRCGLIHRCLALDIRMRIRSARAGLGIRSIVSYTGDFHRVGLSACTVCAVFPDGSTTRDGLDAVRDGFGAQYPDVELQLLFASEAQTLLLLNNDGEIPADAGAAEVYFELNPELAFLR